MSESNRLLREYVSATSEYVREKMTACLVPESNRLLREYESETSEYVREEDDIMRRVRVLLHANVSVTSGKVCDQETESIARLRRHQAKGRWSGLPDLVSGVNPVFV